MRAMTIAVLGLSLGASAALAQEPALKSEKSDIKGLAAPAAGTVTISSTFQHGLRADGRQLKADNPGKASLKSAGAATTSEPVSEAVRSSLSTRPSTGEGAAGSIKPQGRQSLAAAAQSGRSSFGLQSSGGSPGAESLKEPGLVQKLR